MHIVFSFWLLHCNIFLLNCDAFLFQTEAGSALHEASLFCKQDVVRLLLAHGKTWFLHVFFGLCYFSWLVCTNRCCYKYKTSKHASAFQNCLMLCIAGVDPNITDSVNRTVLEVISEHKSHISLEIGQVITGKCIWFHNMFRQTGKRHIHITMSYLHSLYILSLLALRHHKHILRLFCSFTLLFNDS